MRKSSFVLVVAAVVVWASASSAQLTAAVDGSLDRADVIREMSPPPPTYAVNSAIVLTNPHNRPAGFKIELFNYDGTDAGSGSVTVGPRQLEVIWVSTLLEDDTRRFVGWGRAKSERPLQCNAFLAGIGVTELPVKERPTRSSSSRAKLFSLLAAF